MVRVLGLAVVRRLLHAGLGDIHPLRGESRITTVDFITALFYEIDEQLCAIPIRSSRAQARTTVGREFPISALSMAERGPSPAIGHVSCALSKIPHSPTFRGRRSVSDGEGGS